MKKTKLKIIDLDCLDGKYFVGNLVTLSHPWVNKDAAEEILDIYNSHIDCISEMLDSPIQNIHRF